MGNKQKSDSEAKPRVNAVIVAGGRGSRLGKEVPKAFVLLAGKPLFIYSLWEFDTNPAIERSILVVPEDLIISAETLIKEYGLSKKIIVASGGQQRWESVRNGVLLCSNGCEWVLVHDAARPFVSKDICDSLLNKRDSFLCAITATPVVDTIRTYKGDQTTGTIDRNRLIRVGTPQLFQRAALVEAFTYAIDMNPPPTDEAQLMELKGYKVGFSWGDPLNFKITTPEDLVLAEQLISSGIFHKGIANRVV